jgi:alkylhydroperoxidase family enzyme
MSAHGFLNPAPASEAAEQLFARDLEGIGYVMNLSRLWAHLPAGEQAVKDLIETAAKSAALTYRQRAVLVTAAAAEFGDSYCSLMWGNRLARVSDGEVAAGVVRGEEDGLDESERALARWARLVARDPAAIQQEDVEALRAAGFDDSQVFAVTLFVGVRLAFAIVNDALGALPDAQLASSVPTSLLDAVRFGRPMAAPEE